MRKQFELTCPVHACASPPSPSQLCNKSILSCQALWKDALREETSDQKAAPSSERCESFSGRRSGTSHMRGGVFKDTPTISLLFRCQSSTKKQPSGDKQAGRSAAHRAVLSFRSHNDAWDFFSPWARAGSPWESSCLWQLYLCQNKMFLPGEEKISLKTLMQHLFTYLFITFVWFFFFFFNSGVESAFCSKEQVKEMFLVMFLVWAADIFRAAFKKGFKRINESFQFLMIFMGGKMIN